MDGLKVFWTSIARSQRDSVFAYWNERNKSTAYSKALNLIIRRRTDLIRTYPEIGKLTIFKETRALAIGHYSILYQIKRPQIIITAFWDNRDDPGKLFKLLNTE